jgi:uncharacterized protein
VGSAATPRRSDDRWPRPFLGALFFGCFFFFASGVLAQFSDAKLLLGQDIGIVLLSLALIELFFRGALADRVGLFKSTVAFIAVFSLARAIFQPAGFGEVAFVALYGLGMGLLRAREDRWSCALASWAWLGLSFGASQSPYFATITFSLLIGSLAVYWKMRRNGLRGALGELGLRRERLLWNSVLGVAATVLAVLGLAALALVFQQQGLNDLENVKEKVSFFPGFLVVYAVSFGPLSEELFFRGLLLPLVGPWGSSALFALFHYGYGSMLEVVSAFGIGLFYCWLYRRTGSLVPPLVSHILYNAISLAVAGRI